MRSHGRRAVLLKLFKFHERAESRQAEREARIEAERPEGAALEQEQNRQDISDSLSASSADPEEAKSFGAVFDKLGWALANGDEATASAMFDVERFSDARTSRP